MREDVKDVVGTLLVAVGSNLPAQSAKRKWKENERGK